MLGAVAELERAKITERMTRGKLHRLRQGVMASGGVAPFGYRANAGIQHRLRIERQHARGDFPLLAFEPRELRIELAIRNAAFLTSSSSIGYTKASPNAPRALVPQEPEAEVVRWMFETYAAGATLRSLAKSLEQRGVRTRFGKKLWAYAQIRDMMNRSGDRH